MGVIRTNRRPKRCASALFTLVLLSTAQGRAANRDSPVGEWIRVGTPETVGIGTLVVTDLMLQLFLKAPDKPRWTQGVLFDDSVRDALLPSSAAARARAATISDVGFYGLPAFLLLADAGLMIWIVQGRADGALQLALVDLEALVITHILTTVIQRSVGRARPFLQACASDPNRPECSLSSNDRNTALLSGHASIAFATASMLCVEHSQIELYGKADFIVCPLAVAVATTTGVLRIVSDKHWATDVLAGAALGTAVGTIVALSHFRTGATPAALHLTAFVDRDTAGIVYRGQY